MRSTGSAFYQNFVGIADLTRRDRFPDRPFRRGYEILLRSAAARFSVKYLSVKYLKVALLLIVACAACAMLPPRALAQIARSTAARGPADEQHPLTGKQPPPSAQVLPELQAIRIGDPEPLGFVFDKRLRPPPRQEIAPVSVPSLRRIFFTTSYSWGCDYATVFAVNALLPVSDCSLLTGPATMNLDRGSYLPPLSSLPSGADWRQAYEGVFDANPVAGPSGRTVLLLILHGEDKNFTTNGNFYQNKVNRDVGVTCASGAPARQYRDCWKAYNGFIGGAYLMPAGSDDRNDLHELGPIVWPSAGYVRGQAKLSNGVRHPSSLVSGGYIYVFYQDTSHESEPGRHGGLVVARATLPVTSKGPRFIPHFAGQWSLENSSLPTGFDALAPESYFGRLGGRADELWPGSRTVIRFSVAHIRGTTFYLGVAEVLDGSRWAIELRLSSDLVAWGRPSRLIDMHGAGWAQGYLHYPMLYDPRSGTNHEIDAASFFIVGSKTAGGTLMQRVTIKICMPRRLTCQN
jgi:hypothetical protein